jgi:membrane-bound serine protease (ClpP class)
MQETFAIVLLIISMGLVLLEAFVPSMGILSLLALGTLGGSLFLGFRSGTTFGFVLIGVALAGIPTLLYVGFRVFPKTPLGRSMILSAPSARGLPADRLARFAGRDGVTLTLLRPSGVAEIDGQRVDVLTRGEILEPGVPIQVIDCSGNRILVRAAQPAAGHNGGET